MEGLFHGVRATPCGRRKVLAFYMTGDLCGLEPGSSHDLAIKAVNLASLAVLPRQSRQRCVKESTESSAALFQAAARSLILAIESNRIIRSGSAEEEFAWFLTMLATRLEGPDARKVNLAVRRQGFADYLALANETTSRALTILSEDGLIKLHAFHRMNFFVLTCSSGWPLSDRTLGLTGCKTGVTGRPHDPTRGLMKAR